MATWRYKKPDKTGHHGLKALLKYVTFREDAHHVVPEDGQERWHDAGLGKSWREVYERSQQLGGQYILAHHFVISPDPDLMLLVPEDHRRAVLAELTIETLTDWYQARDLAIPEMSFVLHDRETTDAAAPGRQMLHSHSFCAGSIPTLEGRTCPMVKERDVVRNKGGLGRETNLNRIVEQNWAAILDREVGFEWRLDRELDKHLQAQNDDTTAAETAIAAPTITDDPLPLSDLSFAELEFEIEPDRFSRRSREIDF
jgi:hypothetical protein